LFDPALFGSAVGLAVLLSLIASWIPAALAARIDPADIVRQE
jgi:ABC-type lipoprotein release transport system permease subunit